MTNRITIHFSLWQVSAAVLLTVPVVRPLETDTVVAVDDFQGLALLLPGVHGVGARAVLRRAETVVAPDRLCNIHNKYGKNFAAKT